MNLAEARQKTTEALERLSRIEKDFGQKAVDKLVDMVRFIEENYSDTLIDEEYIWYVYTGDVVQVNGDVVVYDYDEYVWRNEKWTKVDDLEVEDDE